jgi:hypothetical protein
VFVFPEFVFGAMGAPLAGFCSPVLAVGVPVLGVPVVAPGEAGGVPGVAGVWLLDPGMVPEKSGRPSASSSGPALQPLIASSAATAASAV